MRVCRGKSTYMFAQMQGCRDLMMMHKHVRHKSCVFVVIQGYSSLFEEVVATVIKIIDHLSWIPKVTTLDVYPVLLHTEYLFKESAQQCCPIDLVLIRSHRLVFCHWSKRMRQTTQNWSFNNSIECHVISCTRLIWCQC